MLLTVHETAELVMRLSDTMDLEEWDEIVYRSLWHALEDQKYKTFPTSCFTIIEKVRECVAREEGVKEAFKNVIVTFSSMDLGDLALTLQEPHILVAVSSRWTDELKKFADFKDDHDARWKAICEVDEFELELVCKNLADLIVRTNKIPAAFNGAEKEAALTMLRGIHHFGPSGRYLVVDTDQFEENETTD